MKRMKRIMALLLSLLMVLAMGLTSYAADTSLTIKTTEGHTYQIYQILKGDVSDLSDGSATLANVEKGSSVTSAATAEEIVNALKDKTGGELGNTAYAYVKDGNPVATVVGDGSSKLTTLEEGYYVVTDSYTTTGSDSLSRYMVAVAGPTTMEPKTETPSIDKKIVDTDKNEATDDYKKTDTAAIGDTIEYEITGAVPNYEGYTYYYYVVDDTLSKGLTLDADSFVVKVGDATLTKGTDYYVYTSKDDATGKTNFHLAFANIKDYTKDAAISIKYNATVNEDAVIGTDPNTNTAKLIYSNNPSQSDRGDKEGVPGEPGDSVPTGETPEYITKTYVTQIKLMKVDQDGNALNGAEFTLTGSNLTQVKFTTSTNFTEDENGTYYKLKNGAYTETAPTDETAKYYESTTTKYTKTTSTNLVEATGEQASKNVSSYVGDDGILYFTGLDKGTYTLTETKTPSGFNTIQPISFEIKGDITGATSTVGGSITWSSENENLTWNAATNTFEISITNIAGKLLPSTGGIGTTIFYVAGSILVLGAAVLLITKKRMRRL